MTPQVTRSPYVTTVVDAGGRYGMHPSWSAFRGELHYISFEPDAEEARRLRSKNEHPGFEVQEIALDKEAGTRQLYITRHRGYSSFLKPNENHFWFKYFRPGEAVIEKTTSVTTQTLDMFASERNLSVDFIKIDTEGSELDILQGALTALKKSIIGIRCDLYFQRCYQNQPLFVELFQLLDKNNFFLVNIDYNGRGLPYSKLYRNPDPFSFDFRRYGVLSSADGVFLKNIDALSHEHDVPDNELTAKVLKHAAFAFLNHAPDVALHTLMKYRQEGGLEFDGSVRSTKLYKWLQLICLTYLGEYRVNPNSDEWLLAKEISKVVFDIELGSGNTFWQTKQKLESELI